MYSMMHLTQNQKVLTHLSLWQTIVGSPNTAEKYKRLNRGTSYYNIDLVISKVWKLVKQLIRIYLTAGYWWHVQNRKLIISLTGHSVWLQHNIPVKWSMDGNIARLYHKKCNIFLLISGCIVTYCGGVSTSRETASPDRDSTQFLATKALSSILQALQWTVITCTQSCIKV